MDKFLRGDDGLSSLLSSDTLQAQLDTKVHKNDHAAHADTLSTHAITLGTLSTALDGKQTKITPTNRATFIGTTLGINMAIKQDVITATNRAAFIWTTLGINMASKQDAITDTNKGAVLTVLGLTNISTTLDDKLHTTGTVAPLTIETQQGGVDSPALTLFHTSASTVASYTGIELRVRNTSNYSSGHHEPSVKQVYEYDNGDILGQGRTGNIINRVFYQFMDRTGSFFDTPLPGGTVLHTGPYFNSNGLADFAGGSLTGVNGVSASGTVTAGSVGTSYVTNGSAILRLSGTGPLMLPSKKITTTGGHNDQGKFIGGNPSGPLRPGV